MNYKNKYAQKFKNDMNKTIEKWKKLEDGFYTNTIIPIAINNPTLIGLIKDGKEKFPHKLWLAWVYKYKYPDIKKWSELEDIYEKEGKYHTFKINGTEIPVEKGKRFEDILASRVDTNPILKELAKNLSTKSFKSLEHVGVQNKREDFSLTEEFSIDIKYSDIGSDERFKNIVKPFGNDWYSATIKIQEGILRSMYKEGASQGQFRPKAQGQTKNHGILKRTENGYEEITQEDYDKHNFGAIPSLRKNIIYIYNDDGYWASYCLTKVTQWAANNLENLGFTDYTKDDNYKSYSPNDFWKFSDLDWKKRQMWYGKSK